MLLYILKKKRHNQGHNDNGKGRKKRNNDGNGQYGDVIHTPLKPIIILHVAYAVSKAFLHSSKYLVNFFCVRLIHADPIVIMDRRNPKPFRAAIRQVNPDPHAINGLL